MRSSSLLVLLVVVLALGGVGYWFLTSGAGTSGGGIDLADGGQRKSDAASLDLEASSAATQNASADQELEGEGDQRDAAKRERGTGVFGRLLGPDNRPLVSTTVTLLEGDRSVQRRRRGSGANTIKTMTTTTDNEGRFEFYPSAPTSYLRIEVDAPPLLAFDRSVDPTGGKPVDLGDLHLTRGILISGRVVDPGGKGVAEARVQPRKKGNESFGVFVDIAGGALDLAGGRSRQTDAEGRFEVVVAEPGSWSVLAAHEDFVDAESEVEVKQLGDMVTNLVLQLGPSATIEGVVRGLPEGISAEVRAQKVEPSRNKNPLANAIFAGGTPLVFGRKRAEVDGEGSFRLAGLELDTKYRLAAFDRSGKPLPISISREVEVRSGARAVKLVYEPGVVIVFDALSSDGTPLPSVKGKARLASKGGFNPFEFAAFGNDQTIERGEDGRFRLAPVRADEAGQTCTVDLRSAGHMPIERKDIALPVSGEVDLGTLRFQAAPILRVHVTSMDGKDVKGASVVFDPTEAERPSGGMRMRRSLRVAESSGAAQPVDFGGGAKEVRASTNEDGIAELTLAGDLRGDLRVEHSSFAPTKKSDVVVAPKGTTEVAIQLDIGGSIEVTVVDHEDKAVEGATVGLACLTAGDESLRRKWSSDASGKVKIPGLTAGDYDIWLEAPRKRGEAFVSFSETAAFSAEQAPRPLRGQRVSVVAGRPTAVRLVEAQRTKVIGQVTLDGQPLAGARVRVDKQGAGDMAALLEGVEISGLGDLFGGGGRNAKGKTKADGSYELDDVVVGPQVFVVSHRDLIVPARFEVRANAGETRIDLMIRTASISGSVVDEAGAPVAGCEVEIRRAEEAAAGAMLRTGLAIAADITGGSGGGIVGSSPVSTKVTIESDEEGGFTIPGLPENVAIVLVASGKGYSEAKSDRIVLRAGETKTGVVITVKRGGTIEVRVPAAKAGLGMVFARGSESGAAPKMARIQDGVAKFEGLSAGTWTISLPPVDLTAAGAPEAKEVEVVIGKTATVDF